MVALMTSGDAVREAIERSWMASSRSFVVISRSIVEEFAALKESGYNECGTRPYLATKLTTISVIMSVRNSKVDVWEGRTPLSTVTNRTGHQRLYQSAIDLFGCCIQDALQEVIRLLDLVPVEEICLGQLKLRQLVLLHDSNAEDIGRSKEPAPSGGSLVCDRRAFEWYLDVEFLSV